MLAILLHPLVGLLGFALLYAALFLDENEEGKLQNRLEKLWVDIDDISKTALSKQSAFFQQVSAMANSALNRLFGTKLFSAEAVSASLCFSVSSVLFSVLYFTYRNWLHHVNRFSAGDFLTLVLFISSLLVGCSPVPFRYLGFLWLPAPLIFLLYLGWVDHHHVFSWNWFYPEFFQNVALIGAILGGGFLSDVLFVAFSRWCLRKSSSERENGWKIVFFIILNGCVGIALISPMMLDSIRFKPDYVEPLIWLGMSNMLTGIIATLFIVLALAAVLHLVLWPLLKKPIYSLQRFGVARQPMLLVSTAVTCLLFAWPHNPIVEVAKILVRS